MASVGPGGSRGSGQHRRAIRWRVPPTTAARRWAVVVGAGVAAAMLWRGLASPSGDLRSHLESGRRLLAGEPLYAGGLNFVYPPSWGLAFAPLSLLPQQLVHVALFALAMVALAVVVRVVSRSGSVAGSGEERFFSVALALLLVSPFVMRDLADAGPNLVLLGLVWAGVGLWVRGYDARGGALIGLATALKCTPALYLAYFAWKRQWRVVAAGTVATVLVTVAPAAAMGWPVFVATFATWTGRVWAGVTDLNPAGGVLPAPDVVNVALRPAIASLLDTLGLRLPPDLVGVAILVLQVMLLAALAWHTRRPLTESRGEALPELAAVAIVALLLSPITWKQHCVATLPALLLLSARLASPAGLGRRAFVPMALYGVLVLPLRTDLLGRPLMASIDRLGIRTLALGLLLLALWGVLVSQASSDIGERHGASGDG